MSRISILLLSLVAATALWAVDLPITDVVLFSSGVGYIQRSGTVTDNATIELSFKPEQINDLLKSLVLLDLDGGQVGTINYGSKDPVSRSLQAFAINLTDNPTLGELLNRLRGVMIEVVATNVIQGKILGVETQTKVVDNVKITEEVLNLLTTAGIRAVRLNEITSIRLLDERLNQELQNALAVLATGLDNQRRPVVIAFTGQGQRRVVVGYLTETPVWKTSYRLVLDEQRAVLQGWAVVENTSDADWTNVQLSLVSGRPISFIQDLYTPLYVRRPVVRPELYESLNPVEYEGAVERNAPRATTPQPAPPPAMAPGGTAGPAGRPPAAEAQFGVSADTMAGVSAAAARDLGQAFEYAVQGPVTIPRQQSAMLPIVTGPVEAARYSIYNPEVHARFPLYGLRLKNTTGTHLMGGPITVYNNGVYAGDARFEDLQPGETRLISYAIDLGVAGEARNAGQTQEIIAVKLVRGILTFTRKHRRTTEYTFAVNDGKARQMLVEHRFQPGWDLVEPAKAEERTTTHYRFILPVTPQDGGKLTVVEERIDVSGTRVTDLGTNVLLSYIQQGEVNPRIREALQRIVDMQTRLRDLRQQRSQREQEIATISAEQNRIRQNMAQLDRNSDLYRRYVTMLGDQETRIDQLRKEIAELQAQENALQKELEDYVANLTLE